MGVLNLAILATALFVQTGTAQRPHFGKPVLSPEVHADRTVTFRLRAPGASRVSVEIEEVPTLALSKDEKGIWTGATIPLDPDFYVYAFVVDGVEQGDPSNPLLKPIITGGSQSILHVPGGSLDWEDAPVPRGTVHLHTYDSAAVGEQRSYWVYTPPNYERGKAKYRVLFLLHGVFEDPSAWLNGGRAAVIADNLIAQHRAQPTILVMPNGYGFPQVPDGVGRLFDFATSQKKLMDVVEKSLLEEIVPAIKRDYRATRDSHGWSIAGCSMGGAQALYIGLRHPDQFGAVRAFSPAVIMYGDDNSFFGQLPKSDVAVDVSCGKKDFLFKAVQTFERWLRQRNQKFSSEEGTGGHTWNTWRRDLIRALSQPIKNP